MKKIFAILSVIILSLNMFATGDITIIIKESKHDKRSMPATTTKFLTITGFENASEVEKWATDFGKLTGIKSFVVKEEYKPGSWNCELVFEQGALNKTQFRDHLVRHGVKTVIKGDQAIPAAEFDK